MNLVNKEFRADNRYLFIKSYLNISQVGCCFLLTNKNPYNKNVINNKFVMNNYEYINNNDLLISILFNLKHGLEIFIKYIRILLNDKVKFNHNIHELFTLLKKELIDEYFLIKKTIENDFNDNIVYSGYGYEFSSGYVKLFILPLVDDLDLSICDLEKLVIKYFFYDIITNKTNGRIGCDKDNTFFKYPENSFSSSIDYYNIMEKIKRKNIIEILNDIYFIEKLLYIFHNLLEIYSISKLKKNKGIV